MSLTAHKDIDEAKLWAVRGMSLGSVSCEILLAIIQVKEDTEVALSRLQELSSVTNAEALLFLGMLCEGDDRKKYLERSAYLGSKNAYLQLSLYCKSVGDMCEFKYWYCMYFIYKAR